MYYMYKTKAKSYLSINILLDFYIIVFISDYLKE